MSTKHTPGPWKAYCRDVGHKENEPWPEDEFLQWEVNGPRVPDGRGEFYEADARLIAAAPDLLFQLLAASNYIDALGGDSKSYRAAIAKATGDAA
jgi:hypothetical protein